MKKQKNNSEKNSIKYKIISRTLMIVLVSQLISLTMTFVLVSGIRKITDISMNRFEKIAVQKSSDALADLASSEAVSEAERGALYFKRELDAMLGTLDTLKEGIDDIYNRSSMYEPVPFDHPHDCPADTLCMQWVLPENTEMAGDIENETYLLGNMTSQFTASLNKYDNILSIYYTSASGINIGCDSTPQNKPEYYDGRNADWYVNANDSDGIYISVPYEDSFGRGKMITASVPCYDESGDLRGVCGLDILIEDLGHVISSISVGEDSFTVLVSSDGIIYAGNDISDPVKKMISDTYEAFVRDSAKINESQTADGTAFCCIYTPVNISDWSIATIISKDKITAPSQEVSSAMVRLLGDISKNSSYIMMVTILIWTLITSAVIIISVIIIKKAAENISAPIVRLSDAVEKAGTGDLEYKCDIKTNDEIEKLSDSFGKMTVSLKEYIENNTKLAAEKERISTELHLATQIQSDMLPSIFPPFPDKKEFDIFASMNPAKEVGGDFYDFFMKDDDHIALVIADVSGKGIPAALFMMSSKILINNCTLSCECDPAEILSVVNRRICANNPTGMFVTVWLGILEISTGKLICCNAGHEYPAIRRKNGQFELIKDKHGLFIGAMENSKYKNYEIILEAGDSLFVYTDGVPEATNGSSELFGNERMLAALNSEKTASLDTLLKNVKSATENFVGNAPQFDDLTMLTLSYYGTDSTV